ncbi:hypothetical protein CcaCcLH18_12171 [Colletotrichum camelliae]|nr:hypothetical protein CcaCcLH18_12171 [Colletotrichum camelliae]
MTGERTAEVYETVEGPTLGRGAFGSVRLVRRQRDGKSLACKSIKFEKQTRDEIEREIGLLGRLDHPNILRYFDAQWKPDEALIYTEFCNGQDLESYAKSKRLKSPEWPTEAELWSIIYQLSAALAYCHHGIIRWHTGRLLQELQDITGQIWKPVLHRDIKPLNVLAQQCPSGRLVVKLADFGLARTVQPDANEQGYSFVGTRPYIAPEVTRDHPNWSTKADIFALGCTFHHFVMGQPPFMDQLGSSFRPQPRNLPGQYHKDLQHVISNCLQYEPEGRDSAEKIFRQAVLKVESEIAMLTCIDLNESNNRVAAKQSTVMEASLGEEIFLLDQEDYFEECLECRNGELRTWIDKMRSRGRKVYLIVGHIAYSDARVQRAEESMNSGVSIGAGVSVGVSVGSSSSRSKSREFEKPGLCVQAAELREVVKRSRFSSELILGSSSTTYFWGPKARPDFGE